MAERNSNNSNLVYSTEHGKMCPSCNKPVENCNCKNKKKVVPGDGIVRITLEKKGRKGKGVSVITGIPLDNFELKSLSKKLKQKCGTGGTVKNGVIEIQGDHRELLKSELTKSGYKVKFSGG